MNELKQKCRGGVVAKKYVRLVVLGMALSIIVASGQPAQSYKYPECFPEAALDIDNSIGGEDSGPSRDGWLAQEASAGNAVKGDEPKKKPREMDMEEPISITGQAHRPGVEFIYQRKTLGWESDFPASAQRRSDLE